MDSPWAHKRRAKITTIVSTIVVVVFVLYVYFATYTPPNCFDGKQNQNEQGVDCGGVCDLMCPAQVLPLKTAWVRPFEVFPGVWNVMAYVQNPNVGIYAKHITYTFTFYDNAGEIIGTKKGQTFITDDPVQPIFEGNIAFVDNRRPFRTTFQWNNMGQWYKKNTTYNVVVGKREFYVPPVGEGVRAQIHNKEPVPIHNIEAVVIVYGEDKNAIATSRTLVDTIAPREVKDIVFTWPQSFPSLPSRMEIVLRVPPQEDE